MHYKIISVSDFYSKDFYADLRVIAGRSREFDEFYSSALTFLGLDKPVLAKLGIKDAGSIQVGNNSNRDSNSPLYKLSGFNGVFSQPHGLRELLNGMFMVSKL